MSIIRKATVTDLPPIKEWLRIEKGDRTFGFYNNWRSIAEACGRGEMTVMVNNDDQIIAFYVDATYGPDIFEVKPEFRGKGYGTALAEHMLAYWKERRSVLEIECAPEDSLSFWQQLGFRQYSLYGHGTQAYLILHRSYELASGPRVPFTISFYPPERDWNDQIEPMLIYKGDAEKRPDGLLQLPDRAICFDPEHADGSNSDCVARIEVDGVLLLKDKVKRASAAALGVEYDGAYYLDHIDMTFVPV